MSAQEVFHEGELAVQQRAGERAVAIRNGAAISDHVVAGARTFLDSQRIVAAASFTTDRRLWASLWLGPPGFVQSDEQGRLVRVAAPSVASSPHDPVVSLLRPGQPIGLLAIELETRRRLRVNGTVQAIHEGALEILVDEAFPNCPKYIQRRHLTDCAPGDVRGTSARGDELDGPRAALVARVDTAFVASSHLARGVDVSHRGGEPGFIRVEGARTLRFPDYPGNSMFQTLGNLEVNPRAGVALVDFEHGRLLSLTGTTAVSYGAEDPLHPSGGTGRYWTFAVEQWVEFSLSSSVGWELLDRSRFNPRASRAG